LKLELTLRVPIGALFQFLVEWFGLPCSAAIQLLERFSGGFTNGMSFITGMLVFMLFPPEQQKRNVQQLVPTNPIITMHFFP